MVEPLFSHRCEICLFLVTCQTTIVQENWYFLLSINTLFAWRLGVANLIAVEFYFSLFLDMKIWASCACIFNSKSAAPGTIWLKFGQIVVR